MFARFYGTSCFLAAAALAGLAVASSVATAQERGLSEFGVERAPERGEGGRPVDVELVLAVDVSWSMNAEEQEIQRAGYAAAFRSEAVQKAIMNGVHGRVAVTYIEWAGTVSQSVVVPWTLIDDRAAADAFAYDLASTEPVRERRTSISAALAYAVPLFAENAFDGLRRVIDVSGDGPNNQGPVVTEARDAAVEYGITVNGLPLMTTGGYGSWGSIEHLDRYYSQCVVGGPGAFVIPVNAWDQFPEAVRRKLVMELAGRPLHSPARVGGELPVVPVQAEEPVDCLIGERLWRERQQRWRDDFR